jgi:uncharacterized membrane protein YcaP (DUF421 family)
MFTMTLSPVELLLRVCLIYAFLFALLRLSGKKHVGEMAPFDLVVLLILSECVQNAIVADDNSLTAAAIAVGTLIGLSHAVGYLTWRSKRASRLLEGTPRVLVRNGRVNNDVLADEQITRTELMEALRREGCTCLTNVRFAVLENDGDITVAERRKPR